MLVSQFGEHIKQLREKSNLLQKDVAASLSIDSPMLSKIENGERKAKREQVLLLADIYKTDKENLISVWLADRIIDVLKNEESAVKALKVAQKNLNNKESKYK